VSSPVDDEALGSFRAADAELDDLRDQQIRARLRELTRDLPDGGGRTPFEGVPSSIAEAPSARRSRGVHWQYVAASVVVVLALGVGLAVRLSVGD
jgi:hypothetical protein